MKLFLRVIFHDQGNSFACKSLPFGNCGELFSAKKTLRDDYTATQFPANILNSKTWSAPNWRNIQKLFVDKIAIVQFYKRISRDVILLTCCLMKLHYRLVAIDTCSNKMPIRVNAFSSNRCRKIIFWLKVCKIIIKKSLEFMKINLSKFNHAREMNLD